MNTFLLFAPLAILGLIVLILGAALMYKFGNVFKSFKDFVVRCFGAVIFYLVSLGCAVVIGGMLEVLCYPMIQGGLMYTGILHRLMHAPMLYILTGLGSLQIAMPDKWAIGQFNGYVSWLISGAMFIFVGGYALGVFPPPSMWTSVSFLELDPMYQEALKWLWPPLYPGVPGFADGC